LPRRCAVLCRAPVSLPEIARAIQRVEITMKTGHRLQRARSRSQHRPGNAALGTTDHGVSTGHSTHRRLANTSKKAKRHAAGLGSEQRLRPLRVPRQLPSSEGVLPSRGLTVNLERRYERAETARQLLLRPSCSTHARTTRTWLYSVSTSE
jgi:hypothetical protein